MKKSIIFLIILIVLILGILGISYKKFFIVTQPKLDMEITSNAFSNNEKIPSKYTCDRENTNPQLTISDVPAEAKSLVLIMDDPDIPKEIKESRNIDVFDHWIVFNIPVGTTIISENSTPGIQGANSAGENKYTGPCPPPKYEPKEHRYFFKIYALDSELNLKEGATKKEVEEAMKEHVIDSNELVGLYSRE